MKKFLRTLAVFLLVLVPVLFAADYALSRYMRRTKTIPMETWRDIMEGKAGADLLIMGNSRPLNACDKEVLDSLLGIPAYNLAIIGNHFATQRFRYGMYRRYNTKPRVILQFVDCYTLNPQISQFEATQYYPWMWNIHFLKGILGFSKLFVLNSSLPFFRYHASRPWSFRMRCKYSDRGFYSFRDYKYRHSEEEVQFSDSETAALMLKDFIRESKEEGIKVVLILPPFRDDFGFAEGCREEMEARFEAIAEECGVPLLDYVSAEMTHDHSYFMDPGHLIMKGAKVFTDTLVHDLVRLGTVEGR